MKRQSHAERAAASGPIALRVYVPPVQLDQVTRDWQSQSEPSMASRRRAIALRKSLEDKR